MAVRYVKNFQVSSQKLQKEGALARYHCEAKQDSYASFKGKKRSATLSCVRQIRYV